MLVLLGAAPAAAAEPTLTWSSPVTVSPDSINDIDCPTTELCVAVDQSGNVITSTNPTGPAGEWSSANVVVAQLKAVSCPSASKCVAVGSGGSRVVSTHPTGGAPAWTADSVGSSDLFALSCRGGTCAALDSAGRIVIFGKPSGGGPEVSKIFEVDGGAFEPSAVDCPTSTFCVIVGSEAHNLGGGFFVQENAVVTLTDPVESSLSFSHSFIGFRSDLTSVSCQPSLFCVAVDQEGNRWFAFQPDSVNWSYAPIDPNEGLVDLSCPIEGFCVGLDDSSHALTTNSPTGELDSWGSTPLPTSGLIAVSCPSMSLCLAAGVNQVSVGTPAPPPPPAEQPGFETSSPPVTTFPSPPPPPMPPSLRYAGWNQIAVKNGKAKVRFSCASGFAACGGRLRLFAFPAAQGGSKKLTTKRKRILVGAAWITVSANQTQSITIKINRGGRVLLAKTKKIAGEVNVESRVDGQHLRPIVRKPVMLRVKS